MSEQESRYARHNLIDWWDQKRLAQAKIMVVGAGAIGNEVLKNLALLGVGNLWVVDFDTIDISNLTRCVLFRESDKGKSKAEVAAERVREMNPDIQAHALHADLALDVGQGVYRAMDVVLGCLDSVHARLALNQICQRMGVPWINGGIEATVAEVALFQNGKGACFECTMSPALWERQHERYSCSGLRAESAEEKMPTTAVVASLVAAYMVNEALYLLHQRAGEPKEGLEFSHKIHLLTKPYRFEIYRIPESDECQAHETWEPIETVPLSPKETTTRGTLERMETPEGVLELGFDLVTEMRCVECGQTEPVLLPLEKCGVFLSHCPQCQKASRQAECISWLDAGSPFAETRLSALGIPERQVLETRWRGVSRYVQLSGELS